MLAQDDDESELVQSYRILRGVALGLFMAMVTSVILTSSPEANRGRVIQGALERDHEVAIQNRVVCCAKAGSNCLARASLQHSR